jgi:hypothetical protein
MRKNASPEGRPVLGTLPAAASKHLIAFVVEVIEFQIALLQSSQDKTNDCSLVRYLAFNDMVN